MMESYVMGLGMLVGNLHSLEFALRAFLFNEDPRPAFEEDQALAALKVGDSVPVNAFTNYDSLRALIQKYNQRVAPSRRIDEKLAELRDALAHGRLSSDTAAFPLRLLKFSEPLGNRATVTWAETLTPEWLRSQRERVFEALALVVGEPLDPPA